MTGPQASPPDPEKRRPTSNPNATAADQGATLIPDSQKALDETQAKADVDQGATFIDNPEKTSAATPNQERTTKARPKSASASSGQKKKVIQLGDFLLCGRSRDNAAHQQTNH